MGDNNLNGLVSPVYFEDPNHSGKGYQGPVSPNDPNNPITHRQAPGSSFQRTFLNPNTGRIETHQVDETADPRTQFQGLQDDNSQSARGFSLGGDAKFASGLVDAANAKAMGFQSRQAPQADLTQDNAARTIQNQAAGFYQNQMNGTGPSVAALQSAQGIGAGNSAMLPGLASGSTGNIRNAILGANQANAATSMNGATARLGEMNAGVNGYGATLGQMRQSDISKGIQQAGLDMDQRKQNDLMTNTYAGQAQGIAKLNMQNGISRRDAIIADDASAKQQASSDAAKGLSRDRETQSDIQGGTSAALGTIGLITLLNKNGGNNVQTQQVTPQTGLVNATDANGRPYGS